MRPSWLDGVRDARPPSEGASGFIADLVRPPHWVFDAGFDVTRETVR